jgi:hypothetical protein
MAAGGRSEYFLSDAVAGEIAHGWTAAAQKTSAPTEQAAPDFCLSWLGWSPEIASIFLVQAEVEIWPLIWKVGLRRYICSATSPTSFFNCPLS